MTLTKARKKEILERFLNGQGAYVISNEMNINYRTAAKYCEKADAMMKELTAAINDAIKQQILTNLDMFTEKYASMEVIHYAETGNTRDSKATN